MNGIDPQQRKPRIVLGITGSIAAYKAADLASRMIKNGMDVYPVLTPGGSEFITPVTMRALTGNNCPVGVFDEPLPGQISHIWLAQQTDLIVVAPASLSFLGRVTHGIASDLLTSIIMASTVPVLFAPAMNTAMWLNEANQDNIMTLNKRGYHIVEPAEGRLACRTEGIGKLADVSEIYDAIVALLSKSEELKGKRVLITAGPTREPIDPVRYISNKSSGKMGYALAQAAKDKGATVTLITGPTNLPVPIGVNSIKVTTAQEMAVVTLAEALNADIVIGAAAVADYRPANPLPNKVKKTTDNIELSLVKNPDIIAEVAKNRKQDQIIVAFAAETDNVIENARLKLSNKKVDWIVSNDVTLEGAGFDTDTNKVTVIGSNGFVLETPQQTKREIAGIILDTIIKESHK